MRISDWSSDVCSSDLEILVKEFAHRKLGARHALTQILHDRTAHALAVGNGEEVAEALEPRLVRHVRGMCRHNELHRPRTISVQLRHERGRERSEEGRVGKEGVSTCRSRRSPLKSKKK